MLVDKTPSRAAAGTQGIAILPTMLKQLRRGSFSALDPDITSTGAFS
jgi:hypothetical protein